jgi:chemotaxis protein histidine kinase CheA
LIEGKYDAAASTFTTLAAEAKDRQPLLNWTRLHAGLTALVQGKPAPAREQFLQVERSAPSSTATADAPLATFFVESARKLAAPEAIPAAVVTGLNLNGVDAFFALAAGLHDWQLGKFADAASILEAFTSSQPAGEFAWINDYKPIAAKHLADHRAWTQWSDAPQQVATAAEARAAIEKLRAVEKKLQTKGALAETVKAELKRLTAEASKREKAEKQAADAERKRAIAEQTPLWEAARAEALKHVLVFDFAAALNAVDRAALTDPSLKAAQADEHKKLSWLQEWKATLIDDINAGRCTAAIELAGTSYNGAAKATEARIALRLPYGTAETEWTKLPAATLLGMSTALLKPDAPDLAERQWLCAAFAATFEQANAARELSAAAVKAKPEYKNDLRLLALPKP